MSEPRPRQVSLADVARAAGVSAATVSRALSGRGHVSARSAKAVAQAAEDLGYVVSSAASSLASGRSRTIGVLMAYLHRWFFSSVLTGISETLTHQGYDLTLYHVTDQAEVREQIFRSFLRRQHVDGVIVVALDLDEWEATQLQELGIPVIVIGGRPGPLPGMAVDDRGVTELATEHLLRLGHRRIGFIGGDSSFHQDESDPNYQVPHSRRRAVESALSRWEADLAEEHVQGADFTVAGGHAAARRLFAAPGSDITAVLAASDEMAIGVMLAASELGIPVPERLSVVGIDGHELGEVFGLTTVDQHPLDQGRRAAEYLLKQVSATEHSSGVIESEPTSGSDAEVSLKGSLPYELVLRRSTCAPQ